MTARVHSSIGDSSQKSRQRNFVISDETLGERPNPTVDRPRVQQPITPAMAAELRQQAVEREQNSSNRSLQEARRRIEIITGLGRKTKEVVIYSEMGKITFTLRSLKSFEQEALSQVMESVSMTLGNGRISFSPTGMNKIKMEALSHSLYMIDGQSVDVVLGTVNDEYEEQVSARKYLLQEMDAALVDHLFVQYERLASEITDGYMPKNEEELKGVVEDIRKSGEDTRTSIHKTSDESVRETT